MRSHRWSTGRSFATTASVAAAVLTTLGVSVCMADAWAQADADASAAPVSADTAPAALADNGANAAAADATTPASQTEAASSGASGQIAEVIVTATKRRKNLRDIPASIASIPGDELEQRNAQTAQDIVKLVPGVNYTEAPDSPPRITVRGISAQPATSFTTGVMFGDVSFTDEYVPLVALDPNPFDLQSVDVLKGPQGTLFGASGFNGAIRYVPKAPEFGVWRIKYFGEYTDLSDGGLKPTYGGAVNAPIGEDLALRVTGFHRDSPGYVDNLRTGKNDANEVTQDGVRGILGWQPSDPFMARLTYAWQGTQIDDASTTDNGDGNLSSNVRPRSSPQQNRYQLADLNLAYDFGGARLVSESSYVYKKLDNYFDASRTLLGGALPLLAQVYAAHSDTYAQELRLVSPDDKNAAWQWVTGAFWSRQKVYDRLDITLGDPSVPVDVLLPVLDALLPGLGGLAGPDGQLDAVSTVSDVTVEEKAIFGEVTRRLWTDLELTLGGRYYWTNSGGSNTLGGAITLATTGSPTSVTQAEIHEQGFNPKASLLWHLTPDVLAYTTAAKGFRVGGVQAGATLPPSPPPPATFKSDTIWNYEAGLRTQWFDRKLHADIAGFYERWHHPQYLQPDSTGLLSFISNVGGVKSVGGEATLQALLPVPGLMLTVSAAYADTVTTEPFTASDGSEVPVGARWPFSPHWQTATTLAYAVDLSPWNLNGAVTHTYMGKATNNLAQEAPVFDYQQWDVQLSIDNERLLWLPEITLSANNLLDERGVVNHVYAGGATPYSDYTYIQPRAITVRLSGHF
ncbi:TonB-dependent receptor [Solimonas terrae]|uniref:TonB-dependent receptor n=1 Tax=Solimonas terrae TaxID=1396819 RepID=A0A6M2BMI5_9GAMM|nr:TonB-dependent receptor [Solimonas terrae]NGY03309.1 TonB-dependent receptor [Solimonas terrae]